MGANIATKEAVGVASQTLATKATQVIRNLSKGTVTTQATTQAVQKTAVTAERQLASKGLKEVVKGRDVIHVTPQGVAIPSDAKYKIPKHFVENKNRMGSYGEFVKDKFVEKLRIDPPTPTGMNGPNYSYYHRSCNPKVHYSPRPGAPDPGFFQ